MCLLQMKKTVTMDEKGGVMANLYMRSRRTGEIKVSVVIVRATSLCIWQIAKKLAQAFGTERYVFDVSEFSDIYGE